MSEDNVVVDEFPDEANLVANWQYRISLLEHQVGILQGRAPKSKIRRTFWLLLNSFLIITPIIGGIVAIFGEDPWKTPVVAAMFGIVVGKTLVDFFLKIGQGPRPHRSILMKDHR